MTVVLKKIDSMSGSFYDSYLLKNDNNLFYASFKYHKFLMELLGCSEDYIIAVENDDIKGVLPLMYLERDGGRVYNSLPYYGSNGGIIADSQEIYSMLMDEYNLRAGDKSTVSSTIITNPISPFPTGGYVHSHIDSRIGQITDLAVDLNTEFESPVYSLIDSSARRNVRKSIKEGITVEKSSQHFDELKKLHRQNMMDISGKPKGEKFFELVPSVFEEGSEFNLYTAWLGGHIVGALLVFYFGKVVEYFTPAVSKEHRSVQPLSAILKVALEEAILRGFEKWNWGGTWLSQEGVYRFKRKWGAEDYKYTYFVQLNDYNILHMDRNEITDKFENFYVVPFGELKT